jgi:HAD superfamily hydrolase (TIGR01450 family)
VPGSVEAIRTLEERAIPYRIVTNTVAGQPRLAVALGGTVRETTSRRNGSSPRFRHRRPFAQRAFAGESLYVLASDDARTEFEGQRLLSHEEAGAQDARVAAVIVGDSPEELTYENLNRAFRLVRNGARLIGMHRNPWWLTPDGPTMDSGAYVTALEFAAAAKAQVIGKPAPAFFSLAVDALAAGRPGARRASLRRTEIAMVGDDIRSDVLAAQRAGLRGVFVLSGKHSLDDLEHLRAEGRRTRLPDAVAPSLADVVAALD